MPTIWSYCKRVGELKDMIELLHRFVARRRIEINEDKSKIVSFDKGSRKSALKWKVNDHTYEEVKSFVYLGMTLQQNGRYTEDRKSRQNC